ncbi:MAG: glycosyltransferase family 4 protein [Minisyncoccia bacterium]
MNNLKIAILNDSPFDVGISSYIYNIYLNLKNHNISTDFYQFSLNSDSSYNFYQNVNLVKGINFGFKKSLQLNQILNFNIKAFKNIETLENYDIIIISNPTLNKLSKYFDNIIGMGLDLYYLFYKSNSLIYSKYIKSQYKLFKNLKFIICDSEYTKLDFIKYLEINEERIQTVYPYVNSKIFYPPDKNFKKIIDIDENDFIILNVAYDSPNKNIETVIKLLYELPKNFKLIRVGRNFRSLKLIEEFNLSDRVYLFEKVESKKLGDIYRSSDFFVFPSLFEGFGIPVIEAMASGLPVITSSRTSLPEVAGDVGFIFDPYDIDGMKNKILELSKDKELYENIKEKSINRARFFSSENQFKNLSIAFKKFLELI